MSQPGQIDYYGWGLGLGIRIGMRYRIGNWDLGLVVTLVVIRDWELRWGWDWGRIAFIMLFEGCVVAGLLKNWHQPCLT